MKTNKIILTIVFGMILLAGVVAANSLNDLSTTMNLSSSSIYGGESVLANFSFSYPPLSENYNSSALIIKLNLTSDNQSNFPVWKKDFKINGYTKKCELGFFGYCFNPKTVPFSCSELNQTTINSTEYGINILSVPDGVFYCYNESDDLSLNEGDNIFLNITPNFAIWPSNYTINASLFYLNDTLPPFINITNKSYFNQYFKKGSDVDFNAKIFDYAGLNAYPSATIYSTIGDTNFPVNVNSNNIYEFVRTLPVNIPEGNWPLIVTATDTSGNTANDSVTLKIDNTAPTIEVVSPTNNFLVSDIIPLKLNITDEKSGVDKSSVKFRLREIIGGMPCPVVGYSLGNYSCSKTGWLSLPLDTTTGFYGKDINTTELNLTSGNYWLDVSASDNLGNVGDLK